MAEQTTPTKEQPGILQSPQSISAAAHFKSPPPSSAPASTAKSASGSRSLSSADSESPPSEFSFRIPKPQGNDRLASWLSSSKHNIMVPASGNTSPAIMVPSSFPTEEDADLLAESTYELVSNTDTASQDGLTPALSLGTASQGDEDNDADDVHSIAASEDSEADYEREVVPSQAQIDLATDIRRRMVCRSTTDLIEDDDDYNVAPPPSRVAIDYVKVAADAARFAAARHDSPSIITESDASDEEANLSDDEDHTHQTLKDSRVALIDEDTPRQSIFESVLAGSDDKPSLGSRSPSIDYMEDALDKPSTPDLSVMWERPDGANIKAGKDSPEHMTRLDYIKAALFDIFSLLTLREPTSAIGGYLRDAMTILLALSVVTLIPTAIFYMDGQVPFARSAAASSVVPVSMTTATTTVVNYHTSVRYVYVTETATSMPPATSASMSPLRSFNMQRLWSPYMVKPATENAPATPSCRFCPNRAMAKRLNAFMHRKVPVPDIASHKAKCLLSSPLRRLRQTFGKVERLLGDFADRAAPSVEEDLLMVVEAAQEASKRFQLGYLRTQLRAKAWWLKMTGREEDSKLYSSRAEKYFKQRAAKLASKA